MTETLAASSSLGKTFLRRLVRSQNIALGVLGGMIGVGGLLNRDLWLLMPMVLVGFIIGLAAAFLLRRGLFLAAAYVFFLGTSVGVSVQIFMRGYQSVSSLFYLWPIMGAMSVLELQGGMIVLVVSGLLYLFLAIAQATGIVSPVIPYESTQVFLHVGSYFVIISLLAYLSWLARQSAIQRLRDTEAMTEEVRRLSETLEIQVKERAADLEKTSQDLQRRAEQLRIVTEVSRAVSQAQDANELLSLVTRLICERFGHYHAGIFLVDEERQYAVLRASNSEGGRRMLQRGHRLALGATSIVGYVAATGRPRMANKVGEDVVWFNNPDLPQTTSEMAVPIVFGERVIGVLDVQSTEPLAFTQEDVEVMSVLANQVAVAVENARLYASSRRLLTEMQATYRQYLRTEWERLARQVRGMRYSPRGVELLTEPLEYPEVKSAAQSGRPVVVEEGERALAIPLKVREEVVGVLHLRAANASRRWLEDDLALAQAIVERAGLALENARLLQEAQRRAVRERTISDISSRISASVNLRNILQTAVEELARVMPGAEVTVQIHGKE